MHGTRLTVGLPIHRAADVLWIAMESLCAQVKPSAGFVWELIVYEDGEREAADAVAVYRERLREAGCETVVYVHCTRRLPLSYKWQHMASIADPDSQVFLLQGADDYSDPMRVAHSYRAIAQDGADWLSARDALFYSRPTGRMVQLDPNLSKGCPTGPFIALRTDALARMVPKPLVTGNDVHIMEAVQPQVVRWLPTMGVCTDGPHTISDRTEWFGLAPPPMIRRTDATLRERVPEDVARRLEAERLPAEERPQVVLKPSDANDGFQAPTPHTSMPPGPTLE